MVLISWLLLSKHFIKPSSLIGIIYLLHLIKDKLWLGNPLGMGAYLPTLSFLSSPTQILLTSQLEKHTVVFTSLQSALSLRSKVICMAACQPC